MKGTDPYAKPPLTKPVFPLYKAGLPWEDDFSWELTNYTVLWFAGIGIVFGGWWALSAKNWFMTNTAS